MVTYLQAGITVVIRITVANKSFKLQILLHTNDYHFCLECAPFKNALICMTRKHTIIGVYMKKVKKK